MLDVVEAATFRLIAQTSPEGGSQGNGTPAPWRARTRTHTHSPHAHTPLTHTRADTQPGQGLPEDARGLRCSRSRLPCGSDPRHPARLPLTTEAPACLRDACTWTAPGSGPPESPENLESPLLQLAFTDLLLWSLPGGLGLCDHPQTQKRREPPGEVSCRGSLRPRDLPRAPAGLCVAATALCAWSGL